MKNIPNKRHGICIKEFIAHDNSVPTETVQGLIKFMKGFGIQLDYAEFETKLTAIYIATEQNLGDLGNAIDILQTAIYAVIFKQRDMTDEERGQYGSCCPSALIELQSLLITYLRQLTNEKSAKNTIFKENHTYIDDFEYAY